MHSRGYVHNKYCETDLARGQGVQNTNTGIGTEQFVVVLLPVDQLQPIHLLLCLHTTHTSRRGPHSVSSSGVWQTDLQLSESDLVLLHLSLEFSDSLNIFWSGLSALVQMV